MSYEPAYMQSELLDELYEVLKRNQLGPRHGFMAVIIMLAEIADHNGIDRETLADMVLKARVMRMPRNHQVS